MVNIKTKIHENQKTSHELENQYTWMRRDDVGGTVAEFQKRRDTLYDKQTDIITENEELLSEKEDIEANLPVLCEPVVRNLDKVLQENYIKLQAYHGRSMVGNHCHKYLKEEVTDKICDSVVSMTNSLIEHEPRRLIARNISEKFKKLNKTYATVHTSISHSDTVTPAEIETIKSNIEQYMHNFRSLTDTKITPKQHLLECHCIPFIEKWGFGLGLLGEQGGEECHAFINILKSRTYGVTSRLGDTDIFRLI